MTSLDDARLGREARARVEAALARDPGLGEELEMIVAMLGGAARERFWRAFADGCGSGKRPAAAVLAALEDAAMLGPD